MTLLVHKFSSFISRLRYSLSAYRNCKLAYRKKSEWAFNQLYAYRHSLSSCHDKGCDLSDDHDSTNNAVISIITDCHFNPGLVDKLRAILSIYAMCKKLHIPYRIYWDYPFDLSDYLTPARYNWLITEADISWGKGSEYIEVDYKGLIFEKVTDQHIIKKALKRFKRIIKNASAYQLHFYSNTFFGICHFKSSFDELFKPSPRLQAELDKHLKFMGNGYISVSLRFMELLGDFKDQEGISQSLPKKDQEVLIERCMKQLKRIIRQKGKGRKVFVAADSRKFLDRASTLSGVYTVPGDIVHVRYRGSEEAYMKTFVDLLLLRGAEECFLLRTGEMRVSGFPKFASWIGNGKFKLIEF